MSLVAAIIPVCSSSSSHNRRGRVRYPGVVVVISSTISSSCSGFILRWVHFVMGSFCCIRIDIDMMFVQMFGPVVCANDVFVNAGLDRGFRLEALCLPRDAHGGR